jgi:hypothetical protein
MVDANAEFGKEHVCLLNVGKHCLNEKTDDNGWRRIDFTRAMCMANSRTLLEHKKSSMTKVEITRWFICELD